MVLILDGNSEHVSQVKRKNRSFLRRKKPIYDCSRSNEVPEMDEIIEIAPYVRTYVCVTI